MRVSVTAKNTVASTASMKLATDSFLTALKAANPLMAKSLAAKTQRSGTGKLSGIFGMEEAVVWSAGNSNPQSWLMSLRDGGWQAKFSEDLRVGNDDESELSVKGKNPEECAKKLAAGWPALAKKIAKSLQGEIKSLNADIKTLSKY